MKGSFMKRDRHCDVTVTATHLKCTRKKSVGENVTFDIALKSIFAIENQAQGTSSAGNTVIHYASTHKDVLRWKRLVFAGDPELCKNLNDVMSLMLADRGRPQNFLVVINPNAGKKTARRLFHKKVAPLFEVSNIRSQIYETTGIGDGRNALRDIDFNSLDGVISVGGDGLLSEVLTACVFKQQQLLGNNIHDLDVNLKRIPFPIGVIPAGTGNYTAKYLHGTGDIVTAAIKIVLGQTTPMNIVSVHQGDRFQGISHLLSAFGLLGDIMHTCEKYRWMGIVRFKILPFYNVFHRRLIDAVVEFQREGTQIWQSVRGSFYGIGTRVNELVERDSKMVPLFADSALTLCLTTACPLGEHIKQLVKLADQSSGAYNYDFIHLERVIKYRVSISSLESHEGDINQTDSFYMNVDGESLTLNNSKFQISLQHGVIRMFGDVKCCSNTGFVTTESHT